MRVDGVLFRILKKNLPSHLSWAADMVQQQASTTTTKKGGTFQHLVSKVYDTLQQDSEMQKDSKEQKKKSVTFGHVAAIKGKLEKDPSARLTKEERTDTNFKGNASEKHLQAGNEKESRRRTRNRRRRRRRGTCEGSPFPGHADRRSQFSS